MVNIALSAMWGSFAKHGENILQIYNTTPQAFQRWLSNGDI